jgi:hypothetical protein
MHTNSILNGLEIIGKLATRIRTTNRKHQEAIKNKGMQSMQRVELPKTMRSSYPTGKHILACSLSPNG